MNRIKHIVICGMIALLCACSGKSDAPQGEASAPKAKAAAAGPRYVNLQRGSEPEYIDPGLISESVGSDIAIGLFDGLFEYPETMEGDIEPSLALSWEVDKKTQTVWTFQLRKDAKWSDGTPLTAHDFVYSWRRVLNPQLASPYAFALYYLKNGADFHKGKITDPEQIGVRAIDDYTLEATLESPTPYFPYWLAYPVYRPVPKQAVEKHGNKWTRPGNLVSSGAFHLTDWVSHERITLAKSEHFWDAANVPAPGIHFHIVESMDTAIRMYSAGELDAVDKVPVKLVPKYKDHPHYKISPYLSVYYYMFNVEKAPFDNMKVRQAFALAVDRKTLCEKYLFQTCFASSNMVALGMKDYVYAKGLSYDPVRAKQLLAEAGYPNGEGLPEVTLFYNTDDNHRMIASVIQQMWKENLGVTVQIQNEEWKSVLKRYRAGDFQVARHGWVGDYPDPNTFLEIFASDSTQNRTRWKNADFDALLSQAATEMDAQKRLAILGEAEQLFVKQAPVIPMYSYTSTMLIRDTLKHYEINLQNQHPLRRVHIAE